MDLGGRRPDRLRHTRRLRHPRRLHRFGIGQGLGRTLSGNGYLVWTTHFDTAGGKQWT